MRGLIQNKKQHQNRNESSAQLAAMAIAFNKKVSIEKLTKTAAALLAMKMVKVTDSGFRVQMATFQGRETFHNVTATAENKFNCDCYTFEENNICAHVIAAEKFIEKETEEAAARLALKHVCSVCRNATESDSDHWDCELGIPAAAEKFKEETASKGFVRVTHTEIARAIERVKNQEFSARVQKRDVGVYEVESLTSGSFYAVELNRGLFGATAHCSCPDFTFTRLEKNECCKHIAAVYQFERRDSLISLKTAA